MDKTWAEYYQNRVNSPEYIVYFVKKYRPFLTKIVELMPDRIHGVAEFGCGIATTSKILRHRYTQLYGYDICDEMIQLALENVGHDHNLLIHKWDITKKFPQPRRYDLIHSHGVLEHFSDVEIETIFYHQTSYTDHIVHYVPSIGYDKPSFGDERLMPLEKWKEILSAWNVELEYFNQKQDLLISWKKQPVTK